MSQYDSAVIFDVDGPLLDLTPPESAAFFVPFAEEYGLTGLSDDWDSYRIRNDVEIYREILTDRLGATATDDDVTRLSTRYCAVLDVMFESGEAVISPIPGAGRLLDALSQTDGLALGTATANFEAAAQMRLDRAQMWSPVQHFHCGAEGGGAKRVILQRCIARLDLPPDRIVFLGDNLNDLDAATVNRTHFIGFHTDRARRERLSAAGATTVTGDHEETRAVVSRFLSL